MEKDILKPVRWIGSSYDDWKTFPDDVQDVMGYALYLAQVGKKAETAKPMKGFKGTTVMEIVDDYEGNAWRAIYTIHFSDVIYVLHAFQKKSKKGVNTPKTEIDLIKRRLKYAKEHYERHQG